MERIQLAADLTDAIEQAVDVLRNDGVILYPTDTLYGLGADAFSDAAVDKIYDIKGRDEGKPIHCVVADVEMAEQYAEVTNDARLLIERLLPGGITIILKKRQGVGGGIARGIDSIGIRIPKNDFCVQLARSYGKPFTATSANVSGLQSERALEKILEQFSHSNVLQNIGIDLIVDGGELPASAASTVVDLSGEELVILREGTVPAADVWNAIRVERDN